MSVAESIKSRIDKMSEARAVVLLVAASLPVVAGACVAVWLFSGKRDIWFGALTLFICFAYIVFVVVLFNEKLRQIDKVWMQSMKSSLGDIGKEESTGQMNDREKRKLYYRQWIRKRLKRN